MTSNYNLILQKVAYKTLKYFLISLFMLLIFLSKNSVALSIYTFEPMIAAGSFHSIGLNSDGTLVAVGDNTYGQCDISSWSEIEQIAAGSFHSIGLNSDGTVVAAGDNSYGQCNISSWSEIIKVATKENHSIGLNSDGTVVAVGDNTYGQCNVSSFNDITQVAAGARHSVALKSDGTVVAAGDNASGQCDVSSWRNIIQVATGLYHTIALKADGTLEVAGGDSSYGEDNVSSWSNIEQITAGAAYTVGLKTDGTVVAVGADFHDVLNVSSWSNIVQVATGDYHTLGLKTDGTVVTVGRNSSGEGDVSSWNFAITYYLDADADGYGDPDITTNGLVQPVRYVQIGYDCDDTDETIYPGAPEISGDAIDQDCDGEDSDECIENIYFLGDISTLNNNEFMVNCSNLFSTQKGVQYNTSTISDYRNNQDVTILFAQVTNDLSYIVTINIYHPDEDHSTTPSAFSSFSLLPGETVYFLNKEYSMGSDWGISATGNCASHILTGSLDRVQGSQGEFYWGDGLNNLNQEWSSKGVDTSGWFYGSSRWGSNADVYVYKNLLKITQVKDASIFPYSDSAVFAEEGDTVFFRGENGFYGAWVIQDIYYDDTNPMDSSSLDGLWYFVGNGGADFSQAITFSPNKVIHTSPSGATQNSTPAFTWVKDPTSTWYKLWMASDDGQKIFAQWYISTEICSEGNCAVNLEQELSSGNYEWYVKSWNDFGQVWSDGVSFTVQKNTSSPSKINHTSPSGAIQNSTPTFTWVEDSVATWYKCWVGYPSPNGDKIFAKWYYAPNICSGGSCSVTIETDLADGDYEWYIKSWNDYGKVWSDGMNFTITGDS